MHIYIACNAGQELKDVQLEDTDYLCNSGPKTFNTEVLRKLTSPDSPIPDFINHEKGEEWSINALDFLTKLSKAENNSHPPVTLISSLFDLHAKLKLQLACFPEIEYATVIIALRKGLAGAQFRLNKICQRGDSELRLLSVERKQQQIFKESLMDKTSGLTENLGITDASQSRLKSPRILKISSFSTHESDFIKQVETFLNDVRATPFLSRNNDEREMLYSLAKIITMIMELKITTFNQCVELKSKIIDLCIEMQSALKMEAIDKHNSLLKEQKAQIKASARRSKIIKWVVGTLGGVLTGGLAGLLVFFIDHLVEMKTGIGVIAEVTKPITLLMTEITKLLVGLFKLCGWEDGAWVEIASAIIAMIVIVVVAMALKAGVSASVVGKLANNLVKPLIKAVSSTFENLGKYAKNISPKIFNKTLPSKVNELIKNNMKLVEVFTQLPHLVISVIEVYYAWMIGTIKKGLAKVEAELIFLQVIEILIEKVNTNQNQGINSFVYAQKTQLKLMGDLQNSKIQCSRNLVQNIR